MIDSNISATENPLFFDVLIVGSGTAALALALKVPSTLRVAVVTKDELPSTNSAMAQGGIASVGSASDSFESHVQDTLTAGAGLNHIEAVRNIIEQAPDRISELIKWGVRFDQDLTREGGHSHRRIFHFADQTGAEIHRALLQETHRRTNVSFFTQHFAIDIIVNKQIDPNIVGPTAANGLYVLDKVSEEVKIFTATSIVLATGGAGKVYLYTSNWSGATGDGIAMAYRAGARVSNLEFMQFHPTCLYHQEARNFLISEAVRGEGGELINSAGEAFMKKHHPLGSLAPRDIVARGIDAEMKKTGAPCVYLDISQKPPDFIKSHFPHIYKECLKFGIDMTKQPIPVVPAAHYLCGGIVTDINGKTDILGLYAIGEVAHSGLHGANRLASNSLLECLAMAHNAALKMQDEWTILGTQKCKIRPKAWKKPNETNSDEMIVISHMWEEIRRLMWNYVGIVRSNKRLERAQHRLQTISQEVKEYYSNMKIHPDIIELRNISIVADLTVQCALKRKESRGIHFSLDYPADTLKNENPSDTILLRGLSS